MVHSYPSFNLPYALDVQLPPVTCLQYSGNCPEELIASFHSINSKLMARNKTKVDIYPSVYLSIGVTVQAVSVSLLAGLCETTGKMLSLWSYTWHTLHLSSQSLKCMWLNYLHHLLCTTLAHFLQMLL